MQTPTVIDFACVIHGDLYSWDYVEKLRNMLHKHLPVAMRFNVFTESHRLVPDGMTRHDLEEWPGVAGHRAAWWYKMQIFDPNRALGQVLYLDLDTVIVNDMSWVTELDPRYFWTIRDFKRLWRPSWQGMNSSFMWFDAQRMSHVWQRFQDLGVQSVRQRYRGDQDFLSEVIPEEQRRFIDVGRALSWRWQVFQGGLDIRSRTYCTPNQPTTIARDTSLIVFHGAPKPHQVPDPVIKKHWY